MQFENVSILSIAYEDAPLRLCSSELEDRLANTLTRLAQPRNIIQSLTGIVARRLWEPGMQPSVAASRVGMKAIKSANLSLNKIGVVGARISMLGMGSGLNSSIMEVIW